MQSGFLLINKPAGPTSHDVIDRLRQITGIKKIGHAGTLDPLASGLLIVAVDRAATRQISRFIKLDKGYEAEMVLGRSSDTYDAEGEIKIVSEDLSALNEAKIKEAVNFFLGEQLQLPPMHSAKKVGGRKLYQLARAGQSIERPAQDIRILDIRILDIKTPKIIFYTRVSSGTYIRSLVHDIGAKLGVGAYMSALKRTEIGPYKIDQAVELDRVDEGNWEEYFVAV